MASNAKQSYLAIASSFELQNMDVDNVTGIVGCFGDISGLDRIRKVALKQRLCEHATTQRFFTIKVDDIVLQISNICAWNQRNEHFGYEQLELEEDEVACYIDTVMIDGQRTHTNRVLTLIDTKFELIANRIIDLVKGRRICKLCDQMIVGMLGFDICSKCALQEPDKKCCRCDVERGVTSNVSGSGWEHPTCKRRRIMTDSD